MHIATLGDLPVTLRIDPAHDARITDEHLVSLMYVDESDEQAHLPSDTRDLAKLLRVRHAVLVKEAKAGRVLFVRYDIEAGRAVAVTAIPKEALSTSDESAWAKVTEALIFEAHEDEVPAELVTATASSISESQLDAAPPPETSLETSIGRAGNSAAEVPGTEPHAPSGRSRTTSMRRVVGGVLAGVGAAVFASGVGLYVRSEHLENRAASLPPGSDEQVRRQADYERSVNLPYIGLGGAALVTTAVPLLMPADSRRSALWRSIAAIAGITGAALVAFGGIRAADEPALGSLLISGGVPLLEIPIVHLLRRDTD